MQQGAEIAAMLTLHGYLCRFQPLADMFPGGKNDRDPEQRGALRHHSRGTKRLLLDSHNATLAQLWPPPGEDELPPGASKREQERLKDRLKKRLYGYNLVEVACFRMT